jgi:hypothetical protein
LPKNSGKKTSAKARTAPMKRLGFSSNIGHANVEVDVAAEGPVIEIQ